MKMVTKSVNLNNGGKMSNFTKMVNDKAICKYVREQMSNYLSKDLQLPEALSVALTLNIKQPSGKAFEMGNLDDGFLLEADGSPLKR